MFKALFTKKLYKVVYKMKGSYGEKTLLVTARDPIDAVKRFYRIAGINAVEDIIDFTEIKYTGDESEHGRSE